MCSDAQKTRVRLQGVSNAKERRKIVPRITIENLNKTKDEIISALDDELSSKYGVSAKTMMLGSDCVVKKNSFSGVFVSVNVKDTKNLTVIGYEKNAPNVLLRGPVAKIFGDSKIMKDVKHAIEKLS